MNAQEIIDATPSEDKNMKIFYPTLFEQDQADTNITKCLRHLL